MKHWSVQPPFLFKMSAGFSSIFTTCEPWNINQLWCLCVLVSFCYRVTGLTENGPGEWRCKTREQFVHKKDASNCESGPAVISGPVTHSDGKNNSLSRMRNACWRMPLCFWLTGMDKCRRPGAGERRGRKGEEREWGEFQCKEVREAREEDGRLQERRGDGREGRNKREMCMHITGFTLGVYELDTFG